ncbi:hypothetical protein ScPMuIL_001792 [Solemya velum]
MDKICQMFFILRAHCFYSGKILQQKIKRNFLRIGCPNTMTVYLRTGITRCSAERRHSGALFKLKKISERFAKGLETAIEAHMKYELINIRLDHEEVLDTVQFLSESVNKLFSVAEESNSRCQDLTDGCCYVFFLEALKTYFGSYCKEFRRVLTNIREKCRTSQGISETEDWSHFQHSLRIIQICGELLLHLEELDCNITSSIIQSVGEICHSCLAYKGLQDVQIWSEISTAVSWFFIS